MRKLESWFPEELVVIGVHSGKFIAERETRNVRRAVLRHGITHPVVNDRQFRIWRSYAVNAWPTLVLIDPLGRVVGQQAGELLAEVLADGIGRLVARAESEGMLDRSPRSFPLEREGEVDRPLRFPAKLLAGGADGRMYVADTGHHRIVVVKVDADGRSGEVEAVVGSGVEGFEDGGWGEAKFCEPHGLALAGSTLYIADTGNHAIRAVDLERRTVTTVAGTGEQAPPRARGGRGRDAALNSPWDVLVHDRAVVIAMAGSHQLWRFDPATLEATPWAGSSAEELFDGSAREAALAQPSGLATDGRRIYFADAESSAIRCLLPGRDASIRTIVGTGLFDFGDRDGEGDAVRLQHPLGLSWHDGALYVADTYNGKVKVVDPVRRTSETVLGGDGELWEPGGLAVAGRLAYIADTNHHRIAVADLREGAIGEFEIRGL